MKKIDDEEFVSRLKWVMADRKVTPWAKKLGLSTGTASRLLENTVPGTDILTAIMRTEHVNLNWLLEGKGTPFMLDAYNDAQAFMNTMRMHASDANYDVYISADVDSGNAAAIFALPASYTFKKKVIEYTHIEVLLGPLTKRLRDEVVHGFLFANSNLKFFTMTDIEWKNFARGQYGSYLLLGDEKRKGLVSRISSLPAGEFLSPPAVVEMMSEFRVQEITAESKDKIALLKKINEAAVKQNIPMSKALRLETLQMLLSMGKPVSHIDQDDIQFALLANQD